MHCIIHNTAWQNQIDLFSVFTISMSECTEKVLESTLICDIYTSPLYCLPILCRGKNCLPLCWGDTAFPGILSGDSCSPWPKNLNCIVLYWSVKLAFFLGLRFQSCGMKTWLWQVIHVLLVTKVQSSLDVLLQAIFQLLSYTPQWSTDPQPILSGLP